MLSNDLIALGITFLLALVWLRLNDIAAERGWVSGQLSRKIIHTGTGPLFVLCWLLFTEAPGARYLAAAVPLVITLQFLLVGSGVIRDEAAVQAMSRTGDRREILRGPLYYGILFVALTILYWRDSPIGLTALMMLSGGDGLADIIGRSLGRTRLPWNRAKTWAGSLAMFLGGWLFAAAVLAIFVSFQALTGSWVSYLPSLTVIALVGTLVESLPLHDIDNLTVTLTAVILGHVLF